MRVRITVAVVFLLLVLSSVAACPAGAETGTTGAQEATTITAATDETTTPSAVEQEKEATTPSAAEANSTATTTSKTSTGGDDNRGIAIAIFLLGALIVAFAYFFYDRWRKSYETLALSTLKTTGRFPDTIFNPVEESQFRARAIGEDAASQKPMVTGPAAVAVGEPATYSATVDNSPADSCAWTIEPADAAKVEPATGASVTVTAGKEGPFTLTAKVGEGEATVIHVAAVAKAGGGGVPLLGTGFAGFSAAIIAMVLAGGLTVLGVLGSEAFIAFLGPLIGYFFAQGRDTGRGASE